MRQVATVAQSFIGLHDAGDQFHLVGHSLGDLAAAGPRWLMLSVMGDLATPATTALMVGASGHG